ncbi:pheromone A receptor-domain-containing protein [Russula brevipes]|nr:pheromone A receptor-domain-containing protein [Russula brevipes]
MRCFLLGHARQTSDSSDRCHRDGRVSASALNRMLQVSISVLKVPMMGHAFPPCSIPCQVLCSPPVLENYNEYPSKRALFCLLFHWFRAVRHSFLLAPRGYVNWQVYSDRAWNAGTCLFMVWTGLGCLMQCINSIVWNKNRIDKAPVYSHIVTARIQVAITVAIPACLLCINRRLYLISTGKAVLPTRAEKRRVVLAELFIGFGIPILQMILQNVVSRDRYRIFEDFGPSPVTVNMLSSFLLVAVWPVVICSVSFMYGVGVIYAFYKFQRQFKRIKPSNSGLNRATTSALCKYSTVFRVMAFISKNRLDTARSLEISRCRIRSLMSSGTFNESSPATSSLHHMGNKTGVMVDVVTIYGVRKNTFSAFSNEFSIPSASITGGLEPDSKIEQYSPFDLTGLCFKDTFEPEPLAQSPELSATTPAVPPASVPPRLPHTTRSTIRPYSTTTTYTV